MNTFQRNYLYAPINAAASGPNEIVAAVAGKRIVVMNYLLIAADEVAATWKSDETGLSGPLPLVANSGAFCECSESIMATGFGEPLVLDLGAAIQVSGHLAYCLETPNLS